MSTDKQDALDRLTEILDALSALGDEAQELIASHFPKELNLCEAYEVFSLGHSSNRYNTTLASVVRDLEEEMRNGDDEDEDEDDDASFERDCVHFDMGRG